MARRLSEAGVRYIQVNYTDNGNNPSWDQHSNMPKHMEHARATDKPVAALLQDLKQRGMLDDTLVLWGGEFGRGPYSQGVLTEDNYGRDHHPRCFTIWMTGGGSKPGITYGESDDFGYNVADNPVHVHDFNATVLYLLGIDHEQLTYKYQGRQYRLTDVHGNVIKDILL